MGIKGIGHPSWAGYRYRPQSLVAMIAEMKCAAEFMRLSHPFDAIAFRGMSGAAAAFPLSAALGVPVVCVRKPGESTHGQAVEGPDTEIANYIIVDDLIETGATVTAIIESLRAKCVGILLYGTLSSHDCWGSVPVFNSKVLAHRSWEQGGVDELPVTRQVSQDETLLAVEQTY